MSQGVGHPSQLNHFRDTGVSVPFPVTASRQPAVSGPLPGGLARFARFLPLAFTLRHFAGRTLDLRARQAHPHLALVADGLDSDKKFQEILISGTVSDAIAHLDI